MGRNDGFLVNGKPHCEMKNSSVRETEEKPSNDDSVKVGESDEKPNALDRYLKTPDPNEELALGRKRTAANENLG